jgi:hypothetical protein
MAMTTTRVVVLLLMAVIALEGCKRRPPPNYPAVQPVSDPSASRAVNVVLPKDALATKAAEMGEAACQARDKSYHARQISVQPLPDGIRYTFDCAP